MNKKQIEMAIQSLKEKYSERKPLCMNEDLIRYRREKSRETLEDAHLLFQAGRLFSALNRIYYSLFYEVMALLLTRDLSSAKHTGIKGLVRRSLSIRNVYWQSGKSQLLAIPIPQCYKNASINGIPDLSENQEKQLFGKKMAT